MNLLHAVACFTLVTITNEYAMCTACSRLFHVDDIPAGMGGDTLDFNKATAVGCSIFVKCDILSLVFKASKC